MTNFPVSFCKKLFFPSTYVVNVKYTRCPLVSNRCTSRLPNDQWAIHYSNLNLGEKYPLPKATFTNSHCSKNSQHLSLSHTLSQEKNSNFRLSSLSRTLALIAFRVTSWIQTQILSFISLQQVVLTFLKLVTLFLIISMAFSSVLPVDTFSISGSRDTYDYKLHPMTSFDNINCDNGVNGTIVHIQNEEENTFLHETFGSYRFWIGASLNRSQLINLQNFTWSNGTEMNYMNWKFDVLNETCTYMSFDGYWLSTPCNSTMNYVCKRLTQISNITDYGGYTYELCSSASRKNVSCGENLLWIADEEESNFILTHFLNEDLVGDVWLGISIQNFTYLFNDSLISSLQAFPQNLTWDNGLGLTFQNWTFTNWTQDGWTFQNISIEEWGTLDNLTEVCVSLGSDGMWTLRDCEDEYSYICKRPIKINPYIEKTFNEYTYVMPQNTSTWDEINCTALDLGDMLWITSSEENTFIRNSYTVSTDIWLGMKIPFLINDTNEEMISLENITWSNNIVATYQNWSLGEPFPLNLNFCAFMDTDGTWDFEVCTESLLYVCTYPRNSTIAYHNGYRYEMPWISSGWNNITCERGSLLWIEDEAEDEFINNNFKEQIWLGLNYTISVNETLSNFTFSWLHGLNVTYSNWGPYHPLYIENITYCVQRHDDGMWYSEDCENEYFFICKELITCNGINSTSDEVCNGIGECIDGQCICGEGMYCDETGNGNHCPNGTWSQVLASAPEDCYSCPSYYACSSEGITNCNEDNFYPRSKNEGESACFECPPGFFIEEFRNMRVCSICPMGHFCPGNASIIECLGNLYSMEFGQDECSVCPNNSFVTDNRFFCINCTSDEVCIGDGSRFICTDGQIVNATCLPCPPYHICENGIAYNCSAGYYLNTDNECIMCPIGSSCSGVGSPEPCENEFYSDTPGLAECLRCPAGRYSDGRGVYCRDCLSGSICQNGIDIVTCNEGEYYDYSEAMCKVCPIGFFCTNQLRFECPTGYYANVTGLTSCYACPAGTFHLGSTGTSIDDCTPCPQGTYSSSLAAIQCIDCPLGYWSEILGATTIEDCVPCSAGRIYREDENGVLSCLPCPSGSYNPVAGGTECFLCPIGTYSGSGESNCTDCAPGSYSTEEGASECLLCPAGTYNPETGSNSTSACIECESGGSFIIGASNITVCTNCTMGYFVNGTECIVCPKGSYSDTIDAPACTLCSAGYYRNSTGGMSIDDCLPCGPGSYSFEGASECIACLPGEFSIKVASTEPCNICPAGTYSPSQSSKCFDCPIGTYSINGSPSCTPCPKGHFSNTTNSIYCYECDQGSYNDVEGADQCILCDPGTYNSKFASSSADDCLPCPIGTYSTTVSVKNVTRCIPCPAGAFCDHEGMSRPNSCPRGTYSSIIGSTSRDNCIPCPLGLYSDIYGSTGVTNCKPCPIGHYLPKRGSPSINECIACPPGSITESDAPSSFADCIPCPAGSYSAAAGEPCTLCPRGSYNIHSNSSDYTACVPCDPPKITKDMGSTNESDCFSCEDGYFVNQLYTCNACPFGTYFNTSKDPLAFPVRGDCIDCGEGYYQPLSAQYRYNSCLLCPPGTYGPNSRNFACTPCGPGHYSLLPGGKQFDSCLKCPPGTWSDVVIANTSDVCIPCAPGLYNPSPGGTSKDSCLLCPVGTRSETANSSTCEECEPLQCIYPGSSFNLSHSVIMEITAYNDPKTILSIIPSNFSTLQLAFPLGAVGLLLLLFLVALLIIICKYRKQILTIFKKLDFGFAMKTKPPPNWPPIKTPTSFGGILSVIILLAYASVIMVIFVDFVWNNKLVIDSVTLSQTQQISGTFIFEVTVPGIHEQCNATYGLSGFTVDERTWNCLPGVHHFNETILQGCKCTFICTNCQPFGNEQTLEMDFMGDIMTPVILFKVGVSHYIPEELYEMEGSLIATNTLFTGRSPSHTISFNLKNIHYVPISNMNSIYDAIGISQTEDVMKGYSVQLTSKIPGNSVPLSNFVIQNGLHIFFHLDPVVGAEVSTEVIRQNIFMFFAQVITLSSVFLTIGAIIFFLYSSFWLCVRSLYRRLFKRKKKRKRRKMKTMNTMTPVMPF